jgi:signal transduction histidine kinase
MSMKAIDEAIMSIKEIANNISPHVLRNFGLVSGIQSFISKINEANTVKITLNAETEARFDENTESSVFRIVAELINNTIKHAGASAANITFSMEDGTLFLNYSDDGIGFNLEKALDKKLSRGINNILNRVKSLGGEISFSEKTRKGFSASISIPVSGHIINR